MGFHWNLDLVGGEALCLWLVRALTFELGYDIIYLTIEKQTNHKGDLHEIPNDLERENEKIQH